MNEKSSHAFEREWRRVCKGMEGGKGKGNYVIIFQSQKSNKVIIISI